MKEKDEIKKVKKYIKTSDTIFIQGHKNLDLDAISSNIGVYYILEKLNKKCYIIIDDVEHEMGVKRVLHEIEGCYNIITSAEIEEKMNKRTKKNLLIILDTNKKELVQSKKALDLIQKRIVIDHHELGKTSIKEGLILVDTKVSSACELVVRLANLYDIKFSSYISTLLLSGITLDTNNFMLNTTEETFYTAYYLTVYGASTKKVQYLLKQDLASYSEEQKLLTNIDILDGGVAIAKGATNALYRRQDLARIADTLLFFNDIEISIVVGKISKDEIGVSARSIERNIEPLMTKLGGGGNENNGAAVISNKKISEIVEQIKKHLKEEAN